LTGETDIISCSSCPGGRYSKPGAASCSICPAGYYSGPGASDCTLCPAGYSSSPDSTTCSICPAGQFSSAGSPTCAACSPGEYSLPGAGACSTCSAGQYSGVGAAVCDICPPGSFSNAGAAFCTTCIAGEYAGPGSPSCQICPAGFFSAAGAEVCTGCPGGTYSPTVGAPSDTFCIPCNPGYYSKVGARKCLACLPGKYSLGAVEECLDCPPGLFSDEGATDCYVLYVTYGANVTGTTTSLASRIGNTLCAGSSMFANLGMITKIVQNIRYMKINVSDELHYAFHAWSADFLIWDIPEDFTSSSESQPLPYVFSQYDMDSRFLVNYWSTLATSLIGVCVYLLLRALKLYLDGVVNKKGVAAIVLDYFLLATSNFAIIQIYGSLDDIIFYAVIDLRFSGFSSGFIAFGSMIAIFLVLFGAGLLALHFWIIWKYKKLKKLPNETGVLEKFIKKFETFQVLYQDFKDTTTIRQSYFALLVIRSFISSLILASLSGKASAQAVLLMIIHGSALLFLILQGPYKEIFAELTQYFYEIIVSVVYSGVLIMAVADEMEKDAVGLRKMLGKGIVFMNAALISGSMVFMCIEIYCKIAEIYDAWLEYKAKKAALKKARIEASSFKKDDTMELSDFTNQTQGNIPRRIMRGSPSRHRIQYTDQLNTSNFLLENQNNTTFEDDNRPSRQRFLNFMPQARQREGLSHATTEPYLLNQNEFNGNMNRRGSIIRPNDPFHQENRRAISTHNLHNNNNSPQNYNNNRSASPNRRGMMMRRSPKKLPMRILNQNNRLKQLNTTEMYTEAADLSPFNVPQQPHFESNYRNNNQNNFNYFEGENLRGNKSAANLITLDPFNTNNTESEYENHYSPQHRNNHREQSRSPQERNQRGKVNGTKAAEMLMLGAFNNKVQKEMLSQYRDFVINQNNSPTGQNPRAGNQQKIRYGN